MRGDAMRKAAWRSWPCAAIYSGPVITGNSIPRTRLDKGRGITKAGRS